MYEAVYREAENEFVYYALFNKSVTESSNDKTDYNKKSIVFDNLCDAFRLLQKNPKPNDFVVINCNRLGTLFTYKTIDLSTRAAKLTLQGSKEVDELGDFIKSYSSTLNKEGTKVIRQDQKLKVEGDVSRGKSENSAAITAIQQVTKNPTVSQWTGKKS
jgi:hypothetical protein